MTSEEIIQRLLDEKKITVKEAMILIKDTCKYVCDSFNHNVKIKEEHKYPMVMTMYGVPGTEDIFKFPSVTSTTFNSHNIKEHNNVHADITGLKETKINE